jgi:hypothetical protein
VGERVDGHRLLWRAEPLGASTFMHVRSEASPEVFALDVDLPAGARLVRPSPDEAVQVRRGEALLAVISTPAAWDADGEPVAVDLRVEGDRLELTVRHRAADVLYPLLVDPSVLERYQWSDQHGDDFYGGWESRPRGDSRWDLFGGKGPQGFGLYIRRDVGHGTQDYANGDSATWELFAPGRSWISWASFQHMTHDRAPGPDTCLEWELRRRDRVRAVGNENCHVFHDETVNLEDRAGADSYHYAPSSLRGGSLALELWMRGAGPRSSFLGYAGAAAVIYNDDDRPTVLHRAAQVDQRPQRHHQGRRLRPRPRPALPASPSRRRPAMERRPRDRRALPPQALPARLRQRHDATDHRDQGRRPASGRGRPSAGRGGRGGRDAPS